MVIDQARQTDQVNLAIGFRAFGMENEDAAALRLLGDILGGKMSSRLFTEVREKRGLAYSVSASPQTYTDSGYVALRAGVALEKAKEATKVILAEAARMKTELVDEEELSEGKRHLRGNLLVHESSSYFAGRNGSNLLLREKLFPVDEELAKIEAVTAEDVKRVAGDVFREEEMTLAVIAERALGAKLEPVLRI
jgi:predicted Zn-dependent peptidase